MSGYTASFTVIRPDNQRYELKQCRMDYSKRVIYTKDLSISIQQGDKLFKQNKDGYIESYLVIHVRAKIALNGVVAIHILQF
ncbi:hypothetical protein B9T31_12220 [Acinetobacter sp. ANC 4558]|nr:hypothetical protein B9T31_12220 [Acinetobacter sp. ANC 4558]